MNNKGVIEGVEIRPITVHGDERGSLFEIIRSDDAVFRKFGQAYITKCLPGWVKGWHYHKIQTDYFCVLRGIAKIVLFDRRPSSASAQAVQEVIQRGDSPALLIIPPGVVHGFENCCDEEVWILNVPTEPYNRRNPDEFRIPLNDSVIPYTPWRNRKGW